MDLHANPSEMGADEPRSAAATTRLEPMLIRLPPSLAERLRALARATRIRQSDYLREAVADLLAKYSHVLGEERPS
jgi:Ribbon-helix-helix domain